MQPVEEGVRSEKNKVNKITNEMPTPIMSSGNNDLEQKISRKKFQKFE
jgi:hypothetical protein